LLSLDPQSLSDVEVLMRAFVVHLVGGKLLLSSVESNTYFLFVLLDLFPSGLGLLVLQLELFLALEELLLKPLL
jgi:hypothetical protein